MAEARLPDVEVGDGGEAAEVRARWLGQRAERRHRPAVEARLVRRRRLQPVDDRRADAGRARCTTTASRPSTVTVRCARRPARGRRAARRGGSRAKTSSAGRSGRRLTREKWAARRGASRSRSATLTRWRSSTCWRVLAACGMSCSAKKPATSASCSGRVRVLTGSTMRTIDGFGNAALAWSQCSRTNRQACSPRSRLRMQRASAYGAFCDLTSGPSRNSRVRAISVLVREVGQRVQVPELLLGCRRLLEALDVAVVLGRAAGRRDDADHGRGDRGVDGCRVPQLLLEQLGGRGLRAGVVTEHGEGPDEEPAQLAGRGRPRPRRPASRGPAGAGPTSSRTKARNRSRGSPSSRRSHQPRPATSVRQTATSGSSAKPAASWQKAVAVHRAGDDRRPGVVDERVPLDGRQLALRRRRQPGAERVVVRDAVEAVAAAVDHDDGVGRDQGEPQLVLVEQHLRLLRRAHDRRRAGVGPAGDDLAHADRDGPAGVADGRRVGALLVEEEAVLAEHERRAVGVERGGDEGIALLPDPAVHDAPDRLAGGGLERVPQVGRLGVPVAVLGQVVADAVPEPLLAQVLLQHAEERAALLVGQDVEHPVGVLRRHDLELDGPGGRQAVGLEGRRALEAEGLPPLPGRPEGVAGRHLHEGGEGLVEPDPVPPAHGHEVAEPHVRELVRHDVGDELLLGLRGRRRVDEQDALPERDAAQVLHGPGREVGQRDEVDLVRRVGDPVVVLEPPEGELPDLQPEAGQRAPCPARGPGASGRRRRRPGPWPPAARR